nr:hypothetical protein [Tanacetum cinerariifolium]
MESLSPQVVSASKLPILNPNEFDLWKMIEQYFLMTDDSLWEDILNGNFSAPTRVVDGVLQPVAPTTAEQRTHTLIWRNNTDLEEQSLDDLFNSLKIYEVEVKSSSSASTTTQNIAFVSSSNTDSTNEPVSAAASVSDVSALILVSPLPNVDSLSNAAIYSFFASQSNSPQLDNDDLKQIDADDLEEVDLKWQMAILTVRARRFLQRTGRNLGENRPTSMGFDIRNGAAEPQRRNVLVETSTLNALVSQCDGVRSYDWSFQAEEEPTNYALMAFSSSSSSSDNEVVSCSKAYTKAYATLKYHYDKLTEDYKKSQFNVISYQTGLESVEARLVVYQQNESGFDEDIKLLKLEVQLRDNALVSLRQNLEKAELEMDDLKLKLENFQTSSKSLSELLASQTNAKTGNGYHAVPPPYTGTFMPPKPNLVFNNAPNAVETHHSAFTVKLSPNKLDQNLSPTNTPLAPIIEDWVSNSEDESETKAPQNTTIPKPTCNGKRRNRKACFVCKSLDHLIKDRNYHEKKMAQPTTRNHTHIGNHKQYAQMPLQNPQRHMVPAAVLPQSKPVPITTVRPVSTAVPNIKVTRPRHVKPIVTKPNLPTRWLINHNPSPKASNSPPKVTAIKALAVNAAQGMQEKWEWKPKCPILDHVSCNTSASMTLKRFDYNDALGRSKELLILDAKELKFNLFSVSQMYDKKNNVLFTDTECLVLSPEFKLPDENHVLLRVSRENNMYNVNLNNIVPSGDLTCLFAKATIDESNLWHRRLGHINFKTMNKLVKDSLGKFDGKVDEGFLVGYSVSSKAFRVFNSRTRIVQETLHNTDGYDAFNKKEPEFDVKKPESEVNISPSSSAQSKKHDDKTKREAKGKSLVESLTRYRNLSAEFEDFSYNNINEDNAVGSLVPTIGQISPNNTNNFSATGPLNAAANPTHGKSSCIDTSQLLDDPDMPELEDITYSNDEDDVGAEADFNNLETSITVSPIPTTRVHKDHPVTQIIGDLSSATQTRSMTRVDKDQGGLSQMFNDDFHTCMFACFLSQEEPKRVHQALKDPSWIKAMQEELLQFKMQKVNKARLVAQRHTQEEGIDYEEVFAPVARIEAITLFLAYASFMGFMMYQMDVKSAFLYGTIEEEVYVCQPPRFEDPDYHDKVYKVIKALYGLHQAPRACQDKYVAKILRKFRLTDGKSASTPIDTEKPLLKDPDVKSIFRYLKGKPYLGLWYPKDSPFDLVAYSDSDYAGASLYRKSTTGGCQFLGCRIISWQCKKQTIVATSPTEAEYVAAASCCAQVLWIQNQLLDYGLDQTVSGKDSSNPLMADNLLKVLWYSTHHVALMKNWLVQKQTALRVNTPRSDEDRLELMELMVFLLPSDEKVRVEVYVVDLQVSAVKLILLLLVQKFLLFGLTN